MNKTQIISAAILAVSITLLGILLKCGFDNFSQKDRCVSVKGLSEIDVPADKVICPLVFKEIGDNLHDIYVNVNAKNRAVVSFLKNKGIAESDITIAAPEILDLQAERYGSDHINYRYNVTSVVMVSSSDIKTVQKVIEQQSELLTRGIALVSGDYRYNVSYEFTKLNEIKPQMIEEATKNARAAAEKFAADSDSRLGKIKRATQGQFSISDRDSYTPSIKHVRVVTTVEYYLQD